MKTFDIDGVIVKFIDIDDATEEEAKNYIKYVRDRAKNHVAKIYVELRDDDYIDVKYVAYGDKFERIRRVTGYLVGTLDRWNDAKQAEERDRVKHDTRL